MLPETIPAIAAGLHQEQTEAITETEQAAKRRMETIKTTKSRIRITLEIKTKTKTAKKTGSISGQRLKTADGHKADYSYQIEQLTDLKVLKTENTLNDGKVTTYRGSLKLAHGENKILVAVTYQQKDGTKFTVSKEYTIYYDEEKLLIQTNLSDQTVKSDHISFRAWAQLGKETFALTATLNGTPISADENWDYKDVPLQEGENQIVLDAEKDGKSEQQVYTITYERPQNQNIRFDTDLEDKEVYKKKYRFYAQAFMGSDKVEDLTAWLNGTQLSPTDGDNYEVLLEEGENQITLYAGKKRKQ